MRIREMKSGGETEGGYVGAKLIDAAYAAEGEGEGERDGEGESDGEGSGEGDGDAAIT
jgi:hypothetical protein